ncbi:efflux RND transporter periplasmic adaptor subunit [Brunnivagina elsteri]|uniref:Efflux transporter periplasmic adaptor subunit n=1 Tax=Brunnivagina elsteri CCALA 953 TaxID=987040 RepID=A0A2A2TCK4_9CYAN|nr:efflux RND transporter periplasmic adaptor subunit [Calothrix elsteri]PAX51480.1 efflux transporter periplasmic adaptor subunit [Calothrix elsteri CCALA 953]
MQKPHHTKNQIKSLGHVSSAIVSFLLLTSTTAVLAHAGHGDEFKSVGDTTGTPSSVQVDAETANRLGIKTEQAKKQFLTVGIKTTGQIETLPSQKVEVTTPITGAKVVELLVEPGATVRKGQPVAVVTSPDLVTLRVESQEKRADAIASRQQAQTDLKLAQQNYQRYVQIANAEIVQAQSQVSFAQEKYSKDTQLASEGALPRRNALESQTQLAEAKAKLVSANNRRDVIEAEAQMKRAQSAFQVAQERLRLSDIIYNTRLQQIGNTPNSKGLVTVTAPISGKVTDREVTLGQTFNDAGGKLMTITNDSRVFATANIYEKDLDRVKVGQRVNLQVASLPERNFSGRISRVATSVQGETRVIPVQAEVDNANGQLKPGMFAELEVLTDKTSASAIAIPSSAVVDANGKKIIYIQNSNTFQSTEVTLGQTSDNMVEIKSGLFDGDVVVTQRASQLYAQSLRGGSKKEESEHSHVEITPVKTNNLPIPLWLLGVGGVGIVSAAFAAGSFWSSRRMRQDLVTVGDGDINGLSYEMEVYLDKQPNLLGASVVDKGEKEDKIQQFSF